MEIAVDGICKRYGTRTVLDNISFTTVPGEILAIVGPNGSGKSTLIKLLADLIKPDKGSIMIGSRHVGEIQPAEFAKLIGYVPQYFTFTTYSTVLETVLIGRRPYITWSVDAGELESVQVAMETVGISHYADSHIDELSGGERQKVFIARTLAQDPKIFLFDEPTSSLDIRHQIEVLETMHRLTRGKGSTLVIAVHDLNLAYRYADRVLMLCGGRVIGLGSPGDILLPERIREVYGVEMTIIRLDCTTYLVPAPAVDPQGGNCVLGG